MAETSPFCVVVKGLSNTEVAYPFIGTERVEARIVDLPEPTRDQKVVWEDAPRDADPNTAYGLNIRADVPCRRTGLPSLQISQKSMYIADGGGIHYNPDFSLPYRRVVQGWGEENARIIRTEQETGIERIPTPTPVLYVEGEEEPRELDVEVDVYLVEPSGEIEKDVFDGFNNLPYRYNSEHDAMLCSGVIKLDPEKGLIFTPDDESAEELTIPIEALPKFRRMDIPVLVCEGNFYGEIIRNGAIYWYNPQQ